MDRAQLESKVLEIITTKGAPFPDGPPTLDKPWSSLGMDSLDQLELVMSVEDEFDLEITDETAESFKHGKDVVDYLVTRVK